MHNVMRWKNAALLALAVMVVGCSSNSKKELPPAELQDFTAEVELTSEWNRSVGNGQGDTYSLLTPAVDGDHIYAGAADGVVMAMDRFSGDVLWKQDIERPISGAIGVGAGLVVVGTLKGEVIALDQSTGEQKWIALVPSEVLSAPAVNSDVVVVQTQDDRVIAFDAASGNQRWIYENQPAVLTLRGTSAPVLTSRLAIAGFSTGKVVAIDLARGIPVWEQRVAVPQGRSELDRIVDIDGNLVVTGDTLYVVSYQGRVAGLDIDSGRVLWQREASSYAGLAQGLGSVYVSLVSGTLEAVDERSASALWSNDALARRQLTAPEVFSSYVAFGDFEGYLHLVSQVDGHFVGRKHIDSDGVRARPLVVGDWMYVFGNSGELVALTIR
jgi:outer membrane protein assembly factor BamB